MKSSAALGLLTALAVALVAAPAGGAGLLSPSACGERTLSQPFARWGDTASYFLAPGGDFESAQAGWTFTGGAGGVAGNEPFLVGSPVDRMSLRLPAGSTATSPAFCVDSDEPTLRLFARGPGSLLSTLSIEAEVSTLGVVATVPVGVVSGASARWSPTLPTVFALSLDQLLSGSTVRFRFRPLLFGEWRVDDVYVDPFKDH